MKKAKKKPMGRIGSSFDDFLKEVGVYKAVTARELKARLLADPKVKAEYDALAPEFEIAAELLRARPRAKGGRIKHHQ